ncbi:MAG: TonB-dependent receptor [Verrucomicrobia bacterium]|nr:TonB-dependent receptor [Verrucomicrobiota bacterium]
MTNPLTPSCLAVAALFSDGMVTPALAATTDTERKNYDLDGGDAAGTLKRIAGESGKQIVFLVDVVRGVKTNPVKGEFTARQALHRMVANTGLAVVEDKKTGALMINRAARPESPAARSQANQESRASPEKPPITMKRKNPIALLGTWLAFALGTNLGAPAAEANAVSGVIEGRVYNDVNGVYLNSARVTLEGTNQEMQTNSFGEFRFNQVPLGPATVRIVVSGYAPKSVAASVVAGMPVVLNIGLSLGKKQTPGGDEALVLDSFVVAEQREMSGSAIAINERRAAPNLKNVVAADEFGDNADGNVGEFLKFVSGVTIDYGDADPRYISVRGLPSFGTAVMIDGNPMASAAGGVSRATELVVVSLNNMSRIEVTKSPTPDVPADMIGGSVNMVLKSAFERAKPVFDYRVDLNASLSRSQDVNYVSLARTPGPTRDRSRKVKPGFDFTYINPVSKNFGFTLSAMSANSFTPGVLTTSSWLPVNVGSNLSVSDQPFLRSFGISSFPKEFYRWAFGATLDWQPGPKDVLSVAGTWNRFDTTIVNSNKLFNANGSRTVLPAGFGATFLESATGSGSVSDSVTFYHRIATGYNIRLSHRHNGAIWSLESGCAYSGSISKFLDKEDGVVRTTSANLPNVTLRYDNIIDSRPATISTRTAANTPVDYGSLANYTLNSVGFLPSVNQSLTTSVYSHASRHFNGRLPLRVKTGFAVRREDRDFRSRTQTWNFVGPDGVARTVDDQIALYDLVFTDYSNVNNPFGFPKTEKAGAHKAYDLFVAHPNYFLLNEAAAISSDATQSRKLTETVAAGYLRGDLSLFRNRLKFVGGVRYEETFDDGYGVLNDISATYQRDTGGRMVRDLAGRLVRMPGDAVALARLQYRDRGSHANRHYGDFYPSLNASFQLTEKLLLRASYAETITRPELSNIVPSSTATDPTVTTSTPTITVSNTALKPWSSQCYDIGVEYYFDKPGIIALGVFQKDIQDFFGSVRLQATPQLLAEYGFDESYSNYDIVTRQNVGKARISGVEFEYRQTLTFLPLWARGVSIFVNGTSLHLDGESIADFSGFIRRTTNWGVSLSRPRYTVKLNWNQRGRQRLTAVTGVNVPAGTYQYRNPQLFFDINLEWRTTKHIGVFASVRSLTDSPFEVEIYGPATPNYARKTGYNQYGPQGIFGIKGTF